MKQIFKGKWYAQRFREVRVSAHNIARAYRGGLRKVQGVSVPRSGHHLLVAMLQRYYSGDPTLPDSAHDPAREFTDVVRTGPFVYCEFFHHCKRFPCTDPSVTFQKRHGAHVPWHPTFFYLVQYRHPIQALMSHFEFWCRARGVSGTYQEWQQFSEREIERWRDIVRTWVLHQRSNVLTLSYEQLTEDPAQQLERTLLFFNPEEKIDLSLLSTIIEQSTWAPPRDPQRFRFFDEEYVAQLESKVANEMESLGFLFYGLTIDTK